MFLHAASTVTCLLIGFSSFVRAQCPLSTSVACLSQGEGTNLATRWLTIFQTDASGAGTGAALVNVTLTSNFTYFDEGASFGDPSAVYNSSQAVYESVSGSGYSGNLVTDVKYTNLQSLVGCDFVALRWQSNSKAANATNVTVPVGTAIEYKGNDYLQIDLSTRLIYRVTSSSDLVNYYSQLGDDVIKSK